MMQRDIAGKDYWSQTWSNNSTPDMFDLNDKSLNNKINQEFHQFFSRIIAELKPKNMIEIGCANSIWPIYFNKIHSMEVSGLDYSEIGCQVSQSILKKYNVSGSVYLADMFSPPEDLKNKYGLAVSFGVVEHFQDTAGCLEAVSQFISESGLMLTVIPNLVGIMGLIQKRLDKKVYDVHVLIDKNDLERAHELAGLEIVDSCYFMPLNLNVLNAANRSKLFNKVFRRIISVLSKIVWWFDERICKLPPSRFFSPYIIVVAKRKK